MNHKVLNLQKLYDDAKLLYNNYVVGSDDASADSILMNLEQGVENLKNNWKGIDAGVQINSVIRVYNVMVELRNLLAQLSADSTAVAVHYRNIQNFNAAQQDDLTILSFDTKTKLSEYSDTADTIDINVDANSGKERLDAACNAMDSFIANVRKQYDAIMENWVSGTGRENAQSAFESFNTNVSEYKQVLSEVSLNINTALQNYGLL